MTRKRFIRLVMAEGIQRNQADDLRMRLMLMCNSYEEAYARFRMVKGHLPDLSIRFDDVLSISIEKISQAIKHLADVCRKFPLITESLRKQKEAPDEENIRD